MDSYRVESLKKENEKLKRKVELYKEIFEITIQAVNFENKKGINLFHSSLGKIVKRKNKYYSIIANGKDLKLQKEACGSLSSMLESSGELGNYITNIENNSKIVSSLRGKFIYGEKSYEVSELGIDMERIIKAIQRDAKHECVSILSSCWMSMDKIIENEKKIDEYNKERRTNVSNSQTGNMPKEIIDVGEKKVIKGSDNDVLEKGNTKKIKGSRLKSIFLSNEKVTGKINNMEQLTFEEYQLAIKNNPEVGVLYSQDNYNKIVRLSEVLRQDKVSFLELLEYADDLIELLTLDLLGNNYNNGPFKKFDMNVFLEKYNELYDKCREDFYKLPELERKSIADNIRNNYVDKYRKIVGVSEPCSPAMLEEKCIIIQVNKNIRKELEGKKGNDILDFEHKEQSVGKLLYATKYMSDQDILNIYGSIETTREVYYNEEKDDKEIHLRTMADLQEIFSDVIVKRNNPTEKMELEKIEELKMEACLNVLNEKVKFQPHCRYNPDDLDPNNPEVLRTVEMEKGVNVDVNIDDTRRKDVERVSKMDSYEKEMRLKNSINEKIKVYDYGLSQDIKQLDDIRRQYERLHELYKSLDRGLVLSDNEYVDLISEVDGMFNEESVGKKR